MSNYSTKKGSKPWIIIKDMSYREAVEYCVDHGISISHVQERDQTGRYYIAEYAKN